MEEVRRLAQMGYTRDMVSMQGLGYKEILAYLDGECTLEEARLCPEKRYPAFCQAAAYLVPQRARGDLGKQAGF